MRQVIVTTAMLAVVILVQACSTPRPRVETEAVRDYIAAAELEETGQVRTPTLRSPTATPINEHFAILEGTSGYHLLEFSRRCFALYDTSRITPDVRRDGNVLRARFDTLRGCRIDKMYKIDAAQALELQALGDAPGDEVDPSEG